jgi:hypothetical protein
MIYVDEGILIDPDNSKIEEAMSDMPSHFKLQDKWDLSDYLGVKVGKPPDGSIEFVRAQLIDSTLEDLKLVVHGVGNRDKTYYPPCKHDGKMNRDEGGKELDCSWCYKSVIGNLNYLEEVYQRQYCHQCLSMFMFMVLVPAQEKL